MATFEPAKEVLACYKALEERQKGSIKRSQGLVEYLKTQEQSAWKATISRLNRDMREAKKVMPRKDW